MSRTALFLIALMLAAATAATAATAFAGTKSKLPRVDQTVVDTINASNDAIRRVKVRTLKVSYKADTAFRAPNIRR